MDINVQDAGDYIVISFLGEIDMLSIRNLKDKLFAQAENDKDIKVDFENLDYLDSTGIGILLTLNRLLQEKGNTLHLINVPAKIESILRLSSLNGILN